MRPHGTFVILGICAILFSALNCQEGSPAQVTQFNEVLLVGELAFPYPESTIVKTVKNAAGDSVGIQLVPFPITGADVLIFRRDTISTECEYRTQSNSDGIWQCFVRPGPLMIAAVHLNIVSRIIVVDTLYYEANSVERIQAVPTIAVTD